MEFIFGKEEYLVDQAIKSFLKPFTMLPSVHDETSPVETIIMDIQTVSMFANEKVIIIKDHPVFTSNEVAKKFLTTFEKINPTGVNLLFVITSNYDPSNLVVKYLLNNAITKEIKPLKQQDLPLLIRKIVHRNGGQISSGAVISMMQKFPLNLRLIISEIKKLLMENKNISQRQVEQSIDNYYAEDFFALTNAIVSDDKTSVVKFYYEKILYGQSPVAIIGQIASILNLSMLIDSYKKQGLRLKSISEELRIHIFRIKKANELLINQGAKKIGKLIKNLADLEFNIKAGNIDNARGLDRFILELIR